MIAVANCNQLWAFVDGELTETDARAFRDHLAWCAACVRALHDQMMLEATLSDDDGVAASTDQPSPRARHS